MENFLFQKHCAFTCRLTGLLCLILMLSVADSLSAANAASSYPIDSQRNTLLTDSTSTELSTLEVTSRHISKEITSAAPVHSLSSDDLNRLGITDISDAVHRLPGIVLRDYGGAGGMKTVSVRGLGSQHTGVTFDGAPLSDIQSGQIDLSRYSIDNINSISLSIGDNEDIFVPARATVSASTITLSSWRPDMFNKGISLTAQAKTGAYGYISPYLRLGYGNGENFALLFTGDYTHADNNYPYKIKSGESIYKEKRQNTDLNSGHADISLQWKPTGESQLNAKVYYFDSFRHLPGPAILYNTESHESLKDINIFGQVNYRTRLSSIFSLATFAKYNHAYTAYRDINGKYPNGLLDNRYRQSEAYASVSLLAIPIDNLSLVYAADWYYNYLLSNLNTFNRPHRNSVLQSLGGKYQFGRLTITARALLSIFVDTPGGGETSHTSTRLSPSVALSFQPIAGQNFFVRFNYKNIFRMPTFNELYFEHYGTIQLKPEVTDQLNLGLTYNMGNISWLKNLDITIDGYYNTVRNKIMAIPYNMFLWTMSNMGKAIGYGLDATLDATLPIRHNQDIVITGNYSWQRSFGHTKSDPLSYNKQLAYTPLNSGAFSAAWENPWVSLGVHGYGCSLRQATNNHFGATLPGYFEFGFLAYHTFKFKGHSLELRADLINAFNKQYEIVTRYPMPGRTWQVSVKFKL